MKTAIIALATALLAAPALAQVPAEHQHGTPPATATASDQAAMHERCKAMMGSKMDAKHPHEHSADKQGITAHAKGVKPTAAQMEKMHKQCAEMMAKAEAPAKK